MRTTYGKLALVFVFALLFCAGVAVACLVVLYAGLLALGGGGGLVLIVLLAAFPVWGFVVGRWVHGATGWGVLAGPGTGAIALAAMALAFAVHWHLQSRPPGPSSMTSYFTFYGPTVAGFVLAPPALGAHVAGLVKGRHENR